MTSSRHVAERLSARVRTEQHLQRIAKVVDVAERVRASRVAHQS